jgi:hypothetical protein
MSDDDAVSLIPFDRSQAPLLAEWLARPHVAPWHPDPGAWLRWALNPPQEGAHALIEPAGRSATCAGEWSAAIRSTPSA